MPMQEFLASFAVDIDESGVNRLQAILKDNHALAESLSEAFASAKAALESTFSDLPESLELPVTLDLSKASQALRAFQRSNLTKISLSGDASAVVAAANSALASIKATYAGTTLTLSARVNTDNASASAGSAQAAGSAFSGSGLFRSSTGGRFTRATTTEVAEDGQTEYIIPVQKESIAVPLVRRLLSELSASARESLASDLSSLPGLLSAVPSLASAAPASSSTVQAPVSSSTVQAPVSITVNPASAQPEAVGRSVYNLAERYLLRTLKGAVT